MAVTIYGAGAIGGRTGAYLARAGVDVLLVDKVAEHVDAMNAQGLTISGREEFTVAVRACRPDELRGPLGLTLVAVKSQDTPAALDVIGPLAGPETVVVSLQNGLNALTIADRIGADRTIAAFVNMPCDWLGPGRVESGGAARIWLGELDGRMSERLASIAQVLAAGGDAAIHTTDNVFGYIWSKLLYALTLFVQSVTDLTITETLSNRQYQPLLLALCGEGIAVAEASGIRLEIIPPWEPLKLRVRTEADGAAGRAVLDAYADHVRHDLKQMSGIWRDLAVRRRPTEVEAQVGVMASLARQHGLSVPLIEKVAGMVKELERGERERGPHNLAELEAFRQRLPVAAR